MEFRIRAAGEADAAAIVEVLNPIIRAGTYTVMDTPLGVDDQLAFMRGLADRGVFNVAVRNDDERVLGLQSVEPASPWPTFAHVGEISTFVALQAHRRGIGRALSRATLEAARREGFRKIMATIRADNPDAVAFYASRGFERIGTARGHALVRGRYLDEVLMERGLD